MMFIITPATGAFTPGRARTGIVSFCARLSA